MTRVLPLLALLSMAATADAQIVERKKNDETDYPRVGVEVDWRVSLGHRVDVPGRLVPWWPEERLISHESSGTGWGMSIGPKIRLNSWLDFSVKYQNPKDEPSGGDLVTYWGGYEIGNYACIGQISTENSPINFEVCARTPPLFLKRADSKIDELSAVVSYARSTFDMYYKSGYHKFAQAFYEVEDEFKVGDFAANGVRLGVEYSRSYDHALLVKGYFQLNRISGDLERQAKDFGYDVQEQVLGFELGYLY